MIKPVKLLLLAGIFASTQVYADGLQSQKDKLSYSIGVQMGIQLSQQKDQIDMDKLMMGFKDVFQGNKPQLTPKEMQESIIAFKKDIQAKQMAAEKEAAAKNAAEGEKFLAANAKKKGVKTTKSGLQYRVIKKGHGKSPKATDTVKVHYIGHLVNGKVFDSSYKRGKPVSFPVNGVIPGWTEALQMMKVGSKWEIALPPKLGYGAHGAGRDIGPDSTLIFEVELLDIKDKA